MAFFVFTMCFGAWTEVLSINFAPSKSAIISEIFKGQPSLFRLLPVLVVAVICPTIVVGAIWPPVIP